MTQDSFVEVRMNLKQFLNVYSIKWFGHGIDTHVGCLEQE